MQKRSIPPSTPLHLSARAYFFLQPTLLPQVRISSNRLTRTGDYIYKTLASGNEVTKRLVPGVSLMVLLWWFNLEKTPE